MLNEKRVVIIGCAVLFVLLAALIVCEKRAPEAGTELMRTLLGGLRR